jgi:hypothetical protein
MARPLILLELNEINFEYVQRYAQRGELPHLANLIQRHGYAETTSETRYEELEPWIQWVTAHTGLPLQDHRVFRLGDVVNTDIEQIWELLERQGLSVGAISPMNAKNRTRHPAFFVPDPWTATRVSGSATLRWLHSALAQIVADNAQRRITLASYASVALALAAHLRVSTFASIAGLALHARSRPWNAALLLDRLLADVFILQWRRHRPDFASLFLNAGAHIQHHYFYSSAVYDGEHSNPQWYVPRGADPVLDVLRIYDRIVADCLTLAPSCRLMIATGLHQEPFATPIYYYRLKNHADFLTRLGVRFASVAPRMSRDFLVVCDDATQAGEAARLLGEISAPDGEPLFAIDNRGTDLFVELVYPHRIEPGFVIRRVATPLFDAADDVAFVALKNGGHDGIGYFIDTGTQQFAPQTRFPLSALFTRVLEAMDARSASVAPAAAA